MVHTSDETLLQRWVRQHDADAFAEIVSRHAGMVHATCRRILGDPTEAEDAAQDCFLRLSLVDGWSGPSLIPWLHRLATYRSLDRLRQSKRRRDREWRYAHTVASTQLASWDDIEPYVDEAIAELPEELRGLIIRHYLRGESYSDLAEATGLSRSTVARRVQEGTAKVRETLAKRGLTVKDATFMAALAPYVELPVPAALVSSLGKMAVAGGAAPSLAPAGIVGAIIMTKKTVAITAVALLSIGGAVAYRQWANTPKSAVVQSAQPAAKPAAPIRKAAPAAAAASTGTKRAPNADSAKTSFANILRAAVTRGSGKKSGVKPVPLTSGEIPEDNGAHYFLLATELMPEDPTTWLTDFLEDIEKNGWRDDPKVAEMLRDYKAALDAVRKGVEMGNAELPPWRGVDDSTMHLPKFRTLGRVLALESCMYAASGDYANAVDSYETMLAFAADSSHGGPIIGQLMGSAIQAQAFDDRAPILELSSQSPEQSLAFIADVQKIQSERIPYGQSLSAEAGDLAAWFQESFPNAQSLMDYAKQLDLDVETTQYLARISPKTLYALTRDAVVDYQAAGAMLSLPYYELEPQDAAEIGADNPVSQFLLPDIMLYAEAQARSTAELDGLVLSCAIESYGRQNGSYPASLDALSPAYLAEIPTDPFTGQSYCYAVNGSRYSLYSAGPDMVDSRGVAMNSSGGGAGDIVLNP
ncbi:MAG: sigma-70 family RNA polymerase sigma factor [Candidatus Hydrogenedentales bacterium]